MHQFQSTAFVYQGDEKTQGEWSDSDLADIKKLQKHYPELSEWGEFAIGSAWGSFSENVLMVSWCDWLIEKRDESFLSFCYWMQEHGEWDDYDDFKKLESLTEKWKKQS